MTAAVIGADETKRSYGNENRRISLCLPQQVFLTISG